MFHSKKRFLSTRKELFINLLLGSNVSPNTFSHIKKFFHSKILNVAFVSLAGHDKLPNWPNLPDRLGRHFSTYAGISCPVWSTNQKHKQH